MSWKKNLNCTIFVVCLLFWNNCKSRTFSSALNPKSHLNEGIASPKFRTVQSLIESPWSEFAPIGKCKVSDLVWRDDTGENRPCPALMKGYILGNIHIPQLHLGFQTGVALVLQTHLRNFDDLNNLKGLNLSDDQANLLGEVVNDLHKNYQINYLSIQFFQ